MRGVLPLSSLQITSHTSPVSSPAIATEVVRSPSVDARATTAAQQLGELTHRNLASLVSVCLASSQALAEEEDKKSTDSSGDFDMRSPTLD